MRLCGLSGNIASGKSTVVARLVEEGVCVIDCDVIEREAVAKGTWGHRRVVRAFGGSDSESILASDGSIDREKLGALVFGDPSGNLRRRLNAATHLPITFNLARSILSRWLSCRLVVVVDMPLLFETGFWVLTRPRVLVRCSEETQVKRVMERDGLDKSGARARVEAQAPPEGKAARSHCVLDNEGTVQELKEAASRLLVWGVDGGEEEEEGEGKKENKGNERRRRKRRKRGLLFRGCLWHLLLTPPALAAAVAVIVAMCVTLR